MAKTIRINGIDVPDDRVLVRQVADRNLIMPDDRRIRVADGTAPPTTTVVGRRAELDQAVDAAASVSSLLGVESAAAGRSSGRSGTWSFPVTGSRDGTGRVRTWATC